MTRRRGDAEEEAKNTFERWAWDSEGAGRVKGMEEAEG